MKHLQLLTICRKPRHHSIFEFSEEKTMFSVQVKFKVGDHEVPLERFCALFLKELLRLAQDEIQT